jgi:hypothetical protein
MADIQTTDIKTQDPRTARLLPIERFDQFCLTVKIVGAQFASTVIFLVALYAAAKYEIVHLLK